MKPIRLYVDDGTAIFWSFFWESMASFALAWLVRRVKLHTHVIYSFKANELS